MTKTGKTFWNSNKKYDVKAAKEAAEKAGNEKKEVTEYFGCKNRIDCVI